MDLADEISVLFRAFDYFFSTLPEAFILLDLPGLQLGNDGGFLLLLGEVLIEGQRVVWLFLLTVPGTAVRPLGRLFGIRRGGRSRSRGGPVGVSTFRSPLSIASLSAPLGITTSTARLPIFGGSRLFSSGIVGSSSLNREFGIAFIATPRLVDLLF